MSNAPTHNIYVNVGSGDSSMKLKVGAAWMHKTGDGFNIVLNANSLDGKMVAFSAKSDAEEAPPEAEGKKKAKK